MKPPETQILTQVNDQFLADNAEFFVQSFAALNDVFENYGKLSIISEENKYTVAVSFKTIPDTDDLDVECMLLRPNQNSLRDCLNIVAKK